MNSLGIVESVVTFLVVVFSIGLPVTVGVLLYKIYVKMKSMDEQLKRNQPGLAEGTSHQKTT